MDRLLRRFPERTHILFYLAGSLKRRVSSLWRTRLYANAVFLMAGSIANSLFGLAFWMVVTRLASPADIGLASTLISTTTLLASFSTLGLGYGMIRFLHASGRDPRQFVNSCLTVGGLTSVLVSTFFVLGVTLWSPALSFLRGSFAYFFSFVIFALAWTLSALAENALIARRRAGFTMARNLIWGGLRLALLPLLVLSLSAPLGIFASWGLALGLMLVVSLFLFLPRVEPGYRPRLTVERDVIKHSIRFSLTNYLAEVIYGAPSLVLPLVIINVLGPEQAAFFAVALTISGTLSMISASASRSLFAEGSFAEGQLELNMWRTLKFIAAFLAPAVLFVLAFSGWLLSHLYGHAYAEGATTLARLLALGAFSSATVSVYLSIKRVQKKLATVVAVTLFIGTTTLVLSYVLLPRIGIAGIGVAMLAAEGSVALGIALSFLKRRLWR